MKEIVLKGVHVGTNSLQALMYHTNNQALILQIHMITSKSSEEIHREAIERVLNGPVTLVEALQEMLEDAREGLKE